MAEPTTNMVWMRDQNGEPWKVPAQNVAKARSGGWRLETPEEQTNRKYDNPLLAGAAAAARGVTGGISDIIATVPNPFGDVSSMPEALQQQAIESAEQRRQTLEGLKQANPISSVIGELGGIAGVIALGGPQAALAKLGTRTAAATTEKLAGGGLARGILAKTAGSAAGAAVESAPYAASQILSEEALVGDDGPELTADKVLAQLGISTLFGAGVGGFLGAGLATGSAMKMTAKRMAESVVDQYAKTSGEKVERGVVDIVQDYFAKKIARVGEFTTGVPREETEQFLISGPIGEANRAIGFTPAGRKATVALIDDATQKYDTAIQDTANIMLENKATLKTKQFEKLMTDDGLESVYTRAKNELDAMATELNIIKDSPPGTFAKPTNLVGKGGILDIIEARTKSIDNIIVNNQGAKAKALIFNELDTAKRELGGVASKIEGKFTKMPSDEATVAVVYGNSERTGGLYAKLQNTLEDTALWGDAALAQKEINKPLHDLFRFSKHPSKNKFSFLAEGTEGGFGRVVKAKRSGFESLANELRDPANNEDWRFLVETADARMRIMDAIDKWYDIAPEAKQAVKNFDDNVRSFFELLKSSKETIVKQNQAREIISQAATAKSMFPVGAAGLAIGGPAGAAVATGLRMAVDPASVIKTFTFIDGVRKRANLNIGKAIGQFIDRASGATKKPVEYISRYGSRMVAPGTQSILSRSKFLGGREEKDTKSEQYKTRVSELSKLATDQDLQVARLTRSLGRMEELAPKLSAQVIAKASNAIQYLSNNTTAPRGASTINPVLAFNKWKPSETEIHEFETRLRAADDPLSVLDDLNEGTLTKAAVETIKELHPALFNDIKNELALRVAQIQQELPYETRVQLSILFETTLDPTMEKDFVVAIQGNFGKPNPGKQGTPDAIRSMRNRAQDRAKNLESKSETLAEV